MNRRTLAPWTAAAVIVALVALVWWRGGSESPVPLAPAPAPVPSAERPDVTASSPLPTASVADAPLAAPVADPAPIADGDEAVMAALAERFGRSVVLQLIQTDGFAARVAATVDNLPRGHVAPRLWPLNPTAGRFTVDDDGRIAADNARRYDAAMRLLGALPPAEAAAFYRRLYPQLQAAYEVLGYPGQSFRTRLLEVVDHLLETPAVSRAPLVRLVEVKGDVPSERPWVRYEYTDPALQQLSAGQRLLLRLGPKHQAQVLDWLRALRPLL